MSESSKRSPKLAVISALVVLVAAAGVWGLVAMRGGDPDALPENLTVAGLETQFDDPEKMMRTMENVLDRDDLSDEQRRQIMENVGELWRTRMDTNVNEWFSAPPDQKKAVMDKHIDQFQTAMKVWQKNGDRMRKKWEEYRKRRAAEGKEVDEEEQNPHGPSGWGSRMRSQQGRQTMTQSRDPDRSARMSMYFGAAMARMKERGIEMPWQRGGGSGDRPARRGPRGRQP